MTATERPELVLLDLGLPDMDGLEVIRRLREWSTVPIIVVSVRGQEAEKIAALDRRADDYVTKPFGMGELLARMRAALRHRLQADLDEPVFHSAGLSVDLVRRLVTIDGHEVKLTPKEYDLLRVLVIHAGKVITHRQLLREVWGPVRCMKRITCGCTSGSSARSSNLTRLSPAISSPSQEWATACARRMSVHESNHDGSLPRSRLRCEPRERAIGGRVELTYARGSPKERVTVVPSPDSNVSVPCNCAASRWTSRRPNDAVARDIKPGRKPHPVITHGQHIGALRNAVEGDPNGTAPASRKPML